MIDEIKKKTIIAAGLFVIIILALFYIRNSMTPKAGEDILLQNVKNMQKNIEGLKTGIDDIRDVEKGIMKKKIEEATKEQFQKDEAFLDEIIELKKQKTIAELKRDIERLSSGEKTDESMLPKDKREPAKSLQPVIRASDFMKVVSINIMKKHAWIFTGNIKKIVYEGDKIAGFTILEVKQDSIVVSKEGKEDEILRISTEDLPDNSKRRIR